MYPPPGQPTPPQQPQLHPFQSIPVELVSELGKPVTSMQEPVLDGAKHPQLAPGKRGSFPVVVVVGGGVGPGTPQLSTRVVAGSGMTRQACRRWHVAVGTGAGMPEMQNHPRLPGRPGDAHRGGAAVRFWLGSEGGGGCY